MQTPRNGTERKEMLLRCSPLGKGAMYESFTIFKEGGINMKTLVIILIVVLIVQSCIYAYVNLREYHFGKKIEELRKTMNNATENFVTEKKKYEATIAEQKTYIAALQMELELLKAQKSTSDVRCN